MHHLIYFFIFILHITYEKQLYFVSKSIESFSNKFLFNLIYWHIIINNSEFYLNIIFCIIWTLKHCIFQYIWVIKYNV